MRKTTRTKTGKKSKKKLIAIVAAATVIILGAAATVYFFNGNGASTTGFPASDGATREEAMTALDTDTIYSGVFINGIDVSGKTKDEAILLVDEALSESQSDLSYTFMVENKKYPLPSMAIPYTSNVESVVEEAFNLGRVSSETDEDKALREKYEEYLSLQNTPQYLTLESSSVVDSTAIFKKINDLLLPLETEVIEAKVTGFDMETKTFEIDESQEGLKFDMEALLTEVEKSIEQEDFEKTFLVDVEKTLPESSKEDLENKLGLVVSSTTPEKSGNSNRITNVDLASQKISGTMYMPGEKFDFNPVVGRRTAAAGFLPAPEIIGTGKMEDGIGGGICQVSSTLYLSVMKMGLQVDIRSPHTLVSSYCDAGTDAAVSWGGPEFAFTNNTDYPIVIVMTYKDRVVTSEIYGEKFEEGVTVEFVGWVTGSTPPPPPLYIADPTQPFGYRKQEGDPHNRITASAEVRYMKDGEVIKTVAAPGAVYPASRAQIRVGVMAPDGTELHMDLTTGEVTPPAEAPPPEPPPVEEPADPPTQQTETPTPVPVTPDPDPVTPDPDPVTPDPDPGIPDSPVEPEG